MSANPANVLRAAKAECRKSIDAAQTLKAEAQGLKAELVARIAVFDAQIAAQQGIIDQARLDMAEYDAAILKV